MYFGGYFTSGGTWAATAYNSGPPTTLTAYGTACARSTSSAAGPLPAQPRARAEADVHVVVVVDQPLHRAHLAAPVPSRVLGPTKT